MDRDQLIKVTGNFKMYENGPVYTRDGGHAISRMSLAYNYYYG